MATKIARGEVWIVDLGMVAKIRPCLVLSIPSDDENDRALTALIPHTTSTRQSRFEFTVRYTKYRHNSERKTGPQIGNTERRLVFDGGTVG